jgi:hypothetical protein
MTSPYLSGETVIASRPIQNGTTESTFHFRAMNIAPDGKHALIELCLNTTVLAWSEFNFQRDEDRTRLGNRAHANLSPELKTAFPKEHLKHEFDIFCRRLRQTYLGIYHVEDMEGEINEQGMEYYLKPYLPKDVGSILFGPPGRGKSYVVMIMAVAIDSGDSDWWECGVPANVLFVNLERSARSMRHRLARVNLCLGYPATRSLRMLNARGRTLGDVKDAVKRAIDEHHIEVVCVDSISRAGMGDLTANDKVNNICDTLNNIARTWLAIGHSPRADDSHLFGGVHFDAAADVMIRLSSERQTNSLGISLEITKGNDLPDFPSEYIALDFNGELGLSKIRRPTAMEFSELMTRKKHTLLEDVVEYLTSEGGKASAGTIAQAINKDRANVSGLLNKRDEFIRVGRDTTGILFGLKTEAYIESV